MFFGKEPAAYRLMILLLHMAATWSLYRVALAVLESEEAAFYAVSLYALSWIHWSLLIMVANLPQAMSDALFWSALALYVRPKRGNDWQGFWGCLLLASLAVLFKEHAVVFPIFALALACGKRPTKRLLSHGLIFGAWALLYLFCRFYLFNNPPDSAENY